MTRLGRYQPTNLTLVRDAHTVGSAVLTYPTIPGITVNDAVVISYSLPYAGTPRKLVWSHGFGGGIEWITDTAHPQARFWQSLVIAAEGRYVIVAVSDLVPGDGTTSGGGFGNDQQVTRTELLVNWAYTQWPGDRVALTGHSAGSMTAVNWAWNGNNIDQVACFAIVDGTLTMDDLYVGDPYIQPFVDAAYSPSNWAANKATRDPVAIAALSPALRRIPFRQWYASTDPVIPDSVETNFAAAYGSNFTDTAISSGDHDTVHDFISASQVIAYLDAADWTGEVFFPNLTVNVPTMALTRASSW